MSIYLDQTKDCLHLEYIDNSQESYFNLDDWEQNDIDRMIPSDKSITHRAMFLSFLIDKGGIIQNPLISLDTISTMKVIENLGADLYFILDGKRLNLDINNDLIEKLSKYKNISLNIKPNRYKNDSNDNKDQPIYLNCFGSGTTARLSMGVVCAMEEKKNRNYCIDGSSSLRLRPMRRIVDILLEMGVKVEKKDNLPILIEISKTKDIKVKDHRLLIPSAQLKTMIMFSYLNSLSRYSIRLPSGSRVHTEEMIEELFIKNDAGSIHTSCEYDKNTSNTLEYIELNQTKKISDFNEAHFIVPKDPSSLIFFIILFFILNKSIVFKNVSNSKTRLDYIDVLNSIGFNIKIEDRTKSVTDISILKDSNFHSIKDRFLALKPFNILKEQIASMIDEISSLIILSGFIEGDSYFYGLEELKVKESNRLERSISFLKMFGIDSKVSVDTSSGRVDLVVYGKKYQDIDFNIKDSNNVLYYDSYSDHRMVMIATVISMIMKKNMIIKNVECVKESFPGFLKMIQDLFK